MSIACVDVDGNDAIHFSLFLAADNLLEEDRKDMVKVDVVDTTLARRRLTTKTIELSTMVFLTTLPDVRIDGQGDLRTAELQRSSSQKQSRPRRLLSDMQTRKKVHRNLEKIGNLSIFFTFGETLMDFFSNSVVLESLRINEFNLA